MTEKLPLPTEPTIVFVGGGTGGHIFPNLALLEALRERLWADGVSFDTRFVVSERPVDRSICEHERIPFLPTPMTGLPSGPWRWPEWRRRWRRSQKTLRPLFAAPTVVGVVATGGFVSGPAVIEARRAGRPVALISLDAVPGRANRALARRATRRFVVYEQARRERAFADATQIGPPIRHGSMGGVAPEAARRELGLEPEGPTLLVIGGSQGARTINEAMTELARNLDESSRLRALQVLHLAGREDAERLSRAYDRSGWPARVLPFVERVGLAWSAATLAVSRAGAGGVAEAWANHVPCVFLPYPFHRDEHQRKNAEPLQLAGGAVILKDRKQPGPNAAGLRGALLELLDGDRLPAMRRALRESYPQVGLTPLVQCVVSWLRTAGVGR